MLGFGIALGFWCPFTAADHLHHNAAHSQSYPAAVSHRGCIFDCPENTLLAFAWADELGVDAIELDLRATADSHIVVLHDRTVNRTTQGRGAVHKMTLAEVKQLDAGDGQQIPTLDETFAFARARGLHLVLDIKDSKRIHAPQVIEAVHRHQMNDFVVVGTRNLNLLREFHSQDDRLTTLALVPKPGSVNAYLDEGVDIVRLWARWARNKPWLVNEIQARGTQVWIVTGNLIGPKLDRIVDFGADGLITDHPAAILSLH
jgi:glycerophosphoryl diester phosphodiesterase